MFYTGGRSLGKTPEEREAALDRFLAATLAFGHTGFLVMEGGMTNAVRSYFLLQQLHAAYAQEKAEYIRYADEKGNLLDSSAAVATGAYRRNQVCMRYSNGLIVAVNGHPTETWKAKGLLPTLGPNEWFVVRGELMAWSKTFDGHRQDYVDSPAYVYADGRGHFTTFPKAACDAQMIAHKRAGGSLEVIPVGRCTAFAVLLDGKTGTAVALDIDGKPIGPATTRLSRGLVYITPVAKAFSYAVTPQAAPALTLQCDRQRVIPGEKVTIRGKEEHKYQIPQDAKPGSLLWHQAEGNWIDFNVVPLVEAKLQVDDGLRLELRPNASEPVQAQVLLVGETSPVALKPDAPAILKFPLVLEKEEVRELPIVVTAGDLRYDRTWWLKVEEAIRPVAAASERFQRGECLRKGSEQAFAGNTGTQAHWSEYSCGNVARRCVFMHPPYMTGVGYAFALFEPVDLPRQFPAAFRCLIGKGDGSDPGDGILFRIAVVDAQGRQTIVAEKQWIRHAWTPLEADLSRWAGQRIRVKLVADVGPADNSSGDWACWAEPRIESLRPVLTATIHDKPVTLAHMPAPFPVENLKAEDLRKARRGVLHFQGLGLDHTRPYISSATLNGVSLGELPGAGGDEVHGVWADARLEIPAKAIAALGKSNRLAIDNPGNDSFAVRRFWIELELADGRKASSLVAATPFTQPPEWPYGEGTRVPFGKPIEITIRFRVK
jgi:hypothetical protein